MQKLRMLDLNNGHYHKCCERCRSQITEEPTCVDVGLNSSIHSLGLGEQRTTKSTVISLVRWFIYVCRFFLLQGFRVTGK